MKSHQKTVLLLGFFGWGCLTPDVELGEAPPSASGGTSSTTGGTPSTTSGGTSGMISGGTPGTFANAGTTNSAPAGSGSVATGGGGGDPCDSLLVFPDPALQAGVEESLATNQFTSRSEVTWIKVRGVRSLEGIECLPQLKDFWEITSTADLSPLTRLPQLERVELWESELKNLELLRSYATRHATGLHVFTGPPTPELAELITPDAIQRLLHTLAEAYDQVVVDAGSILDERTMRILEAADTVVLPVYPEIAAGGIAVLEAEPV